MADEVWVSVYIYGPHTEIDRFKALCIVPAQPEDRAGGANTIDFSKIMSLETGREYAGRKAYWVWGFPWNFRGEREKLGEYRFAFDVDTSFPDLAFERLAEMFPTLAFHCECIAGNDDFMGYGWFNVPEGGESFDFYDVPEDYWHTGGNKRGPEAQAKHDALVESLREAVRAASDVGQRH